MTSTFETQEGHMSSTALERPSVKSATALHVETVTKQYPGVIALDAVSFAAYPGEIHALVGENGAGKSTLIGVAAGSVQLDAGEVRIDGEPLTTADPVLAQRLGVAVVYQHPAVLPDLTVMENLVLGAPPGDRPRGPQIRFWARERLARVGADISPDARIDQLSPAGRHLVELARAVASNPKVLILDEPTEPFSASEIETLFALIEELRDNGCCVVYISHRLPDVRRISQRITVLRDGRIQGTFDTSEVSEEKLIELVVGRPLDAQFPPKRRAGATGQTLTVQLDDAIVTNVEFEVLPGEIFGLAGIEGNGQRHVVRAVAGIDRSDGTVKRDGAALRIGSSSAAGRSGIAHIPADRHTEGLFGPLSIRENASVLTLRKVSRWGLLNRRAERDHIREITRDFQVKAPSMETPVQVLSGGNQQKVLVSRAMSADPKVLLADEPTAGVDIGTRAQIYTALRRAADAGTNVIVTSSDAAELAELCDRVAVFSSGRLVSTLAGDNLTEESIVGTALAASPHRGEHQELARYGHLRRFLSGDYLPSALLLVIGMLLVLGTSASSEFFLSERNLSPLLAQVAVLSLVAVGQAAVLMVRGVDLSVGPLMGLVTVVSSYLIPAQASVTEIALGLLAVAAVGVTVGLVNGVLIRYAGITPIVATLITYIGIQGISLVWRPSAGGTFSESISGALSLGVGFVPGTFLAVALLALGAEYALRRTRWGMKLRAVGSDETASLRLAGRATATQLGAYVLCSLAAAAAGVLLSAQNAVGDANSGTTFTLTSITAVVLGGASLLGGRGSFLGAIVGAALLILVMNATTFFGLSVAWQIAAPGLLVLASAALYSRARLGKENA
ncbi:ATP-binding cassette domain-containing protein [Streptomyces sp. NPDC060205]|uniref:ATP-binding cassette domain-containing protein n=1 Tax=Streptomyces sp. NPDC060205 TaxID=3347072 RepID=UPI00365E8C25